jgi:hypothetical protein
MEHEVIGMISSIIVDTVILFLLVYALLDIFTHIADRLCRRYINERPSAVCPVIFLKDGVYNTEAVLRRAIKDYSRAQKIIIVKSVDANLDAEIARCLCDEYETLVLLDREEFIAYVDCELKGEASIHIIDNGTA